MQCFRVLIFLLPDPLPTIAYKLSTDSQLKWLRSRETRLPLEDFFLIFIAADGFPLREGLAGFELTISFGNLGGVMNLRWMGRWLGVCGWSVVWLCACLSVFELSL